MLKQILSKILQITHFLSLGGYVSFSKMSMEGAMIVTQPGLQTLQKKSTEHFLATRYKEKKNSSVSAHNPEKAIMVATQICLKLAKRRKVYAIKFSNVLSFRPLSQNSTGPSIVLYGEANVNGHLSVCLHPPTSDPIWSAKKRSIPHLSNRLYLSYLPD